MHRILLLTSNDGVTSRVASLLAARLKNHFLMKTAEGVRSGSVPLINERAPDVVLVDLPPQDENPEQLLALSLEMVAGLPLIALLSVEDPELELQALKGGAQDCLLLPELTARSLARSIRHAMERAVIERRLAREQEMLNNLLDQLPDRIYFKDLKSRFIRVNKAMLELFRARDSSALIGKTDHDFFTVEHAKPAYKDEQGIMETGSPIINKLERETLPDGEVRWALTSKLPLRGRDGEITGTFGISHDITQMKLLEEAVDAERLRFKLLSEELQERNLQLEQDLVMAKGIQEALLPEAVVMYPGGVGEGDDRVRISSVYRPASAVGGDFFTIVPIDAQRVGVLICDIMGHGLRAALGTAIVRGLVEQLQSDAEIPDAFLTSLNRGLRAILRNIDEPLLVTAFYLVANVETGAISFGTAGHPGPVICDRQSGEVRELPLEKAKRGPALALFDDATYGREEYELEEGRVLLLFTDGAIELSDPTGRVIGIECFLESAHSHVALPADELCRNVLADIQETAGGAEFDDDVCLVALERGSRVGVG
ncbi:MAG: SpoIIE family protein phosphatase [Chthoniobacterales bacterium]